MTCGLLCAVHAQWGLLGLGLCRVSCVPAIVVITMFKGLRDLSAVNDRNFYCVQMEGERNQYSFIACNCVELNEMKGFCKKRN